MTKLETIKNLLKEGKQVSFYNEKNELILNRNNVQDIDSILESINNKDIEKIEYITENIIYITIIIKGYEDLPKDSFEEFTQLLENMDLNVEMLFKTIDNGIDKYKSIFLYNYNEWQRLKKLMLKNPYNNCNHKLSEEIEEAYNYIINTYEEELYYTF